MVHASFRQWALSEMVREGRRGARIAASGGTPVWEAELGFWDLQIIYKGLWDVLPNPDIPDIDPRDPLNPVIQLNDALAGRIEVLEHLVSNLIDVASFGDPDPQPNRLSPDNIFRSIGGADERKAALERHIERLEQAKEQAQELLAQN